MPDVNFIFRRDTDNILIVGSMMNFAQAQSVGHDRIAMFARIRNDVRRVEEFGVVKLAENATVAIRGKNFFTKCTLVQASSGKCGDVPPYSHRRVIFELLIVIHIDR